MLATIARALLTRPDLWPTAGRAGWSLAARGWWRRWPFLPLPDRRWIQFRLVTAYGSHDTADGSHDTAYGSHDTAYGSHDTAYGGHNTAGGFRGEDVVAWLEWRRALPT